MSRHLAYLCQLMHLLYATEAVPKKILELMNVPGLTRENVASHLQVVYKFVELGTFQGSDRFMLFFVFFFSFSFSFIDLSNLCIGQISK